MGWIELGLITSKYSGGFRQRQMELFAHLQDAVDMFLDEVIIVYKDCQTHNPPFSPRSFPKRNMVKNLY